MNGFSAALPAFLPGPPDSPRILQAHQTENGFEEDRFDSFNASYEDSPAQLFGEDFLLSSPYQSPVPTKSTTSSRVTARPPATGRPISQSPPESSSQDSSSDSSGKCKREVSSNSSRSGLAGVDTLMHNMEEHPQYNPSNGITGNETDSMATNKNVNVFNDPSFSLTNRAMERDFDFDSAASSPAPFPDISPYTGSPYRQKNALNRAVQEPRASVNHHANLSTASRELSPLYQMDIAPNVLQHSQPSPASSNEGFVNGTAFNGKFESSIWPFTTPSMNSSSSEGSYGATLQPAAIGVPHDSTATTSMILQTQSTPYTLTVHPTPQKSRVETQIPIKLTLFPFPTGVKKLHLPTHTIAKPKLLAKPTPPRSPEMLELHTMLVCTSAVRDREKLLKALARAAGTVASNIKENRRSSSGDPRLPDENEDKPLNGGPVTICPGCIQRERKRAARKKSKKPEEEEPWQKDEAKRIIVFNCQEVKDWQTPSPPHQTTKAADAVAQGFGASLEPPPFVPDGAMQIDAQMRIACYCRHQSEKLGFQVIFTIKNYLDRLIAQTVTSPIIITDDHKTHALPNGMQPAVAMFGDPSQFAGAGMFIPDPPNNDHSLPYRQAFSTTDLQNLSHNFGNQLRQPTSAFTTPQNPSHTTSATLTPRNLSRQASPSAPVGPYQKRRKASGYGKIPDGLTMTRLQTANASNGSASAGWIPPARANRPIMPTHMYSPFSAPYNGPPAVSVPGPFNTGPPTPNRGDGGFFANQRSQSVENLAMQQPFTAPNSAHQSRRSSPAPGFANNMGAIPAEQAQVLLNSASGLQSPQVPPVIEKIIPGECSTSGGRDVTILGTGFRSGFEVMFGNTVASSTVYYADRCLVCVVPPARHPGMVPVTFRHQFQVQQQQQPYPPNQTSNHQLHFTYTDDDDQELIRLCLTYVGQKQWGVSQDAGAVARRMIQSSSFGPGGWSGNTSSGGQQHHQSTMLSTIESEKAAMESALLSCLEAVDLDDSEFQPRLNMRTQSGQSMLHLSASLGFHRLSAGLLARGANVDLRDRNGMSPMHMASLRGYPQIVRKLRLAGADPGLRSLLGFTPTDMASAREVIDVLRTLDITRSKSAGITPVSYFSRASSFGSFRSSGPPSNIDTEGMIPDTSDNLTHAEERPFDVYPSDKTTAAYLSVRSRRSSISVERSAMQYPPTAANTGFGAPAAAMAAWRDSLAGQIHQFQHSMSWTIPHLQLPTLPPMPYLPGYQAYPMVRRISSLVPQRSPRADPVTMGVDVVKEKDSGWWELLRGTSPSPPSYEEIYPRNEQTDMDKKNVSAALAIADAVVDHKCNVNFDAPDAGEESSTGVHGDRLTHMHEQRIREVHTQKIKGLRNDRKLFLIWIPLLLLVIIAMLSDWIPQALNFIRTVFTYCYQGHRAVVL